MIGRNPRFALAMLAYICSAFVASRASHSQNEEPEFSCVELEIQLYYRAYPLLDDCSEAGTCHWVWEIINGLQCQIAACWDAIDDAVGICPATSEP